MGKARSIRFANPALFRGLFSPPPLSEGGGFVSSIVEEGREEWNRVEKIRYRGFFGILVNGASKIRQTTSPGMRPSVRPPQFRLGFSYKYINIWAAVYITVYYAQGIAS